MNAAIQITGIGSGGDSNLASKRPTLPRRGHTDFGHPASPFLRLTPSQRRRLYPERADKGAGFTLNAQPKAPALP